MFRKCRKGRLKRQMRYAGAVRPRFGPASRQLFDNPTSARARSARTEMNVNSVGFARWQLRTGGKSRRSRVPTRAIFDLFARPFGTPNSGSKRRPLSGNNLALARNKPLVQN